MPSLPARPSAEHLRKAAKRAARERSISLASAQRSIAVEYGFRTWADLMRRVSRMRGEEPVSSPLFEAVRSGDARAVTELLEAGANPNVGDGRESPLHVAARYGPLAVVEALIAGGALDWQTDRRGRKPLDVARRGRAADRAGIVALLDRGTISDPAFRAAVGAIHTGDSAGLARLLDAEPRLLHERLAAPAAYRAARRRSYFLEPKLFWYVANNPTLVETMPSNIVEIARVMIERGVEREDLDYGLALVASSGVAREQGHQAPLIRAMVAAGATISRDVILVSAGHRQREALEAFLEAGHAKDALISAALGDVAALRVALTTANSDDVQAAFGLAVINGRLDAAALALDAGAGVDAWLPVHDHSTALHQAAILDDVALIELLLTRGARSDIRDRLWGGTALDWSRHQEKQAARAALERHGITV